MAATHVTARGTKTVIIDGGTIDVDVPCDRNGTFEPATAPQHQRRLVGVDDMVLSLYAKGLTTGEISAHLAGLWGIGIQPPWHPRS